MYCSAFEQVVLPGIRRLINASIIIIIRKLQVGYNNAFRRRIMTYDRTCSASDMFVSSNVMSFNEIWRKSMYNFKRVTKSNKMLLLLKKLTMYTILPVTKKIWKNFDRVLYIVLCIYLLLHRISLFFNFFTTRCANVRYLYGPIVPEINYSIL